MGVLTLNLTNEQIQATLDGAPEGWTHYCARNRHYFKRDGYTDRIFVWLGGTKIWSVPLMDAVRWLERRERLEEILTLRQRVRELERDWNSEHYHRRAVDDENERLKAQQSEVAARAVEDAVKKYKLSSFAEPDIFSDGLLDYANQLREQSDD